MEKTTSALTITDQSQTVCPYTPHKLYAHEREVQAKKLEDLSAIRLSEYDAYHAFGRDERLSERCEKLA